MANMIMKDALDERIITLLGNNARQSSKVLARQLNISAATVRRRVARLIKDGILHYVAAIDSVKSPYSAVVVLALDVDGFKVKSVADILVRLPEIKWVATTTGRFDILATAYLAESSNLSEFLEKQIGSIEGIRDSETFVCLDVRKGYLIPVGNR
jgi:Lrp/AsnC family transcriptional regulator for asnA, asnC and gidA